MALEGTLSLSIASSGEEGGLFSLMNGMEVHESTSILYINELCLHRHGYIKAIDGGQVCMTDFTRDCFETIKKSAIVIFKPTEAFERRHKECLKYPTVVKSKY